MRDDELRVLEALCAAAESSGGQVHLAPSTVRTLIGCARRVPALVAKLRATETERLRAAKADTDQALRPRRGAAH